MIKKVKMLESVTSATTFTGLGAFGGDSDEGELGVWQSESIICDL